MSAALDRRTMIGGLLLAALSRPASAAPRAEPWPRWAASDESATTTIDHGAWDRFIARYRIRGADGIARIAYRRVLPADREALSLYVATLSGLPITAYRRAEQLAYWLNLYNALILRTVLEHFPVASILDIKLAKGGPWAKKLLHIEGEEVSLDDIEHRILRPLWRDPRVLYGLNNAALGAPDLPPRAVTAANAETLLDQGAHDYVNQPRGVRIDKGRLSVSSLYVWYKPDFGGSDAAVIAHLERFAAPPLSQALAKETRIAGDHFDWALNEVKSL